MGNAQHAAAARERAVNKAVAELLDVADSAKYLDLRVLTPALEEQNARTHQTWRELVECLKVRETTDPLAAVCRAAYIAACAEQAETAQAKQRLAEWITRVERAVRDKQCGDVMVRSAVPIAKLRTTLSVEDVILATKALLSEGEETAQKNAVLDAAMAESNAQQTRAATKAAADAANVSEQAYRDSVMSLAKNQATEEIGAVLRGMSSAHVIVPPNAQSLRVHAMLQAL